MSEARLDIRFVIPSLDIGGTERQLVHLARGLSADHSVRILCTRKTGALAAELDGVVPVESLGVAGGWDPRLHRRLHDAFQVRPPDIVHSFMFGFDHAVNLAARKASVPVVISSRRQQATWKKPRHLRLQRKANALVDCVVANSEAVARFASEQEGLPLRRFRVIPNGIDADAFLSEGDASSLREVYGIPSEKKVVGCVANFSPVKDHALFADLAGCLARRRDDVHFLLVGDGPTRVATEQRIVAAGLSDRCTIISRTHRLADLYALMSVAVLCSTAEGSPNVVAEAMAAGRPVVAAAVGGVPELIEDRVTGHLIASRSATDFADCVGALLDDPDAALRMGEAGSRYVRRDLTVAAMVEANAALYAECLARGAMNSGAA